MKRYCRAPVHLFHLFPWQISYIFNMIAFILVCLLALPCLVCYSQRVRSVVVARFFLFFSVKCMRGMTWLNLILFHLLDEFICCSVGAVLFAWLLLGLVFIYCHFSPLSCTINIIPAILLYEFSIHKSNLRMSSTDNTHTKRCRDGERMEEELLISSTSQSLKCNYTLLVALGRARARAHTLLPIAQPKQLISSASFSLSEICLATRMIIVIILFKIFYSFWFFSARGSHTMLQCSPYKLMFVAVCWAHSLSYFLFDCNGSGTVCVYFFLRLFSPL